MVYRLRFFVLLILASCTPSVNKENIYGEWTAIEAPKYSKDAITEIVTFTHAGDIQVEYLLSGRVVKIVKGKFSIEGKQLTTIYDTARFSFDIHELTKTDFVARQRGSKIYLRLRKIDQ